ncbi:hypothetical protein Y032_0002g1147 [Ancylostoma ceylanicum]|uniref:Uncharacterized protein n=1 Tax=Ancylostoma ceylanicum TaxID=53326 RepID=A0A016VZW3_9BILA|nr:hypothetical protein Y032_0002g1147 [Ancylostoma ceylanicum]
MSAAIKKKQTIRSLAGNHCHPRSAAKLEIFKRARVKISQFNLPKGKLAYGSEADLGSVSGALARYYTLVFKFFLSNIRIFE